MGIMWADVVTTSRGNIIGSRSKKDADRKGKKKGATKRSPSCSTFIVSLKFNGSGVSMFANKEKMPQISTSYLALFLCNEM